MKLAKAIQEKVDALTDVPDAWARGVMKLQPSILLRLQKLTAALTTDANGVIVMDVANLARVDTIIADLQRFLSASDYRGLVAGLADEFTLQQTRTIAYFEAASGIAPTVSTFASASYAKSATASISNIALNVPTVYLTEPIRNSLLEGISTGSSYSDLLTNIQTIVTGSDTVEGNLLRYSRQIVSDSLAITDRQFTGIIADDLGLEWYLYAGGKMKTTRCFCDVRNGLYFHYKEIEGWGRGEGVGSCGFPWAGMYSGTNESTIFAFVGGYNCQHSLLPVSEAIVPDADIQKAKLKGYIS